MAPEQAEGALAALRSHPWGADATRIGEIIAEPTQTVLVQSGFGALIDMLVGDPLPRI